MRAFITGKSGFIGRSLSQYFKDSGIFVLDITKNQKRKFNMLDRSHFADIEKSDIIIHLASKSSIPDSIKNPYDTYHTNILGTLNLLEYARDKGIRKLINISTYVYGTPLYLPIDEDHPINPHSPYNKSKFIVENLCEAYSKDYGIDIVTLRTFNIYGQGSNPKSFIPIALEQISNNRTVYLSSKNTKRDFLFVDDFNVLILKILNDIPHGYNVFNVGYGKSYALEELISKIGKILQCNIDISYDFTIRPNDINEMVADITKVSKKFDWHPSIDIEEGLKRMINGP